MCEGHSNLLLLPAPVSRGCDPVPRYLESRQGANPIGIRAPGAWLSSFGLSDEALEVFCASNVIAFFLCIIVVHHS